MWILLAIAILSVVCFMPVGVIARYDNAGFFLYFRVAFLRFPFVLDYEKTLSKTNQSTDKSSHKTTSQGGSLLRITPLVRVVLVFLNELRKRVLVKKLQVKLVLAGSDPCDLSVLYGKTWAAVGALQTQLNRVLKIRSQNIDVMCDYMSEQTSVCCYVHASISLVRLLALLLRYGKEFMDEYKLLKSKEKAV